MLEWLLSISATVGICSLTYWLLSVEENIKGAVITVFLATIVIIALWVTQAITFPVMNKASVIISCDGRTVSNIVTSRAAIKQPCEKRIIVSLEEDVRVGENVTLHFPLNVSNLEPLVVLENFNPDYLQMVLEYAAIKTSAEYANPRREEIIKEAIKILIANGMKPGNATELFL